MKTNRLLCRLTLGLSLALALALLVLVTESASSSQSPLAPGNPTPHPDPNSHTASPNTAVSITYDEPISPTGVSTQTFAVHAMQTGLLLETYGVHSGTISLTPTHPFQPGELVQVSATTGTLSLVDGQGPTSPTVWQFRVAAVGGSGVFTDSGQSLGVSASLDVALGDLDNDGDLDVFVGNWGQANKVWLNDTTGVLTDTGQFLGSSSSDGVALGDLDGDGDLDAFVANGGQANKVWLNDGTSAFTDSDQSLGSSGSTAIALGDLDGDGDLDAFVADEGSQANKVWLNNGTGVFTDSGQNLGNSDSVDVALGDLDSDGDLDAFIANDSRQANVVWLNDGGIQGGTLGSFSDSGQRLGASGSEGVSLGDLDGDGDLDAFVANGGQANKVWLNDGTSAFTDSGQSLGASSSMAVSLADVDGDGDLDALIGKCSEANKLWLNDGGAQGGTPGRFSDSGQSLGNLCSRDIELGDLDGDGDLDVFVANTSDQPNKVWLGEPAAVYLTPPSQTGQGARAQVVAYEELLTNEAGATDSFDLALGSHVWDTALSTDSLGPIANGDSATFTVYVTVPTDVDWYSTDTVSVTATSVTSPTVYSDTATFTTEAYAPPEISVSPDALTSTQYVNEIVDETLTISNGNGVTSTFNLAGARVTDAALLFHLDEPTGATTFHDDSGNDNHGSCSGASCPTTGLTGRFGWALSFDGTDDYVQINDSASLDVGYGDYTIAAWIRTNSTNTGRIFSKGSFDCATGYMMRMGGYQDSNIHLENAYDGSCLINFEGNVVVNDNQWHFVVGTVDRDVGASIYIDGQLDAQQAYDTSAYDLSNTRNPRIGHSDGGSSEPFDGLIDEVAIYNRTLSAQEVEALYLYGPGGGEVSWLSTDPISGTVPTNSSTPVQITFDAAGVEPGDYTAEIVVLSNDPVTPWVSIPVTMTVVEPHWEVYLPLVLKNSE